jgi:hypothetical protein
VPVVRQCGVLGPQRLHVALLPEGWAFVRLSPRTHKTTVLPAGNGRIRLGTVTQGGVGPSRELTASGLDRVSDVTERSRHKTIYFTTGVPRIL